MRLLRRLIKGLALLAAALIVVLAAPVLWVETLCRPQGEMEGYASLLPPGDRRPEGKTLMTWPEWQIVHAYEDYAKVISTGDPQDYAFFREIGRFWWSTCALSKASGPLGGFSGDSKATIYTIGVSFSLELGLKAAYEQTLGRLAVALRGPTRAHLDDVSAGMAADYAAFLNQTPWYRWDFARDAATLASDASPGLRNWERRTALGLEFRAKAAYAGVVAKAVAATGFDQLTIRSIVKGLPADDLARIPGITVVSLQPEGVEIETARYAAFTDLAKVLAGQGVTFVEIAGNDDILYTAISAHPTEPGALMDFPRQGFGDYRHLFLIKVGALAAALNAGEVEHIHDY